MKIPMIIAGILFLNSAAFCQGLTEKNTNALNQFSVESTQCASFYFIGIQCFSEQSDLKAKTEFEEAKDSLLQFTYMVGQTVGVSDFALMAKIRLTQKSLLNEIDNNCQKFPVLLDRFARKCKALSTDPSARIKQLMAE